MADATVQNDDEARILGRALKLLRERSSLTQPEAAQRFGIESAAGWGKYEAGKLPAIFKPDTQRRLAEAVGATVEELHREKYILSAGPAESDRISERRAFSPPPPSTNVAVYGYAAGQGERIVVADGSEIRWVPMHPAQRGYSRIGAAEIVGESMFPRYKPREIAYFVFDLMPPRGDDMILELNDGTAMVKEYAGRTPERLLLKEYYPTKRIFDVSLKDVKAIHAVVGR